MTRDEPRSRRRRPAAEAARRASQPWAGRCRLSPCAPLRTRRACCLPSSGWWPRRRTQTCSSRTTRAGSCLALRAARKRGQGRPSSWWSPVLGRPARRAVPRAALRRAGRQGEGEGALAAPRPGGQGRAQGRHGHHIRQAVGQDWRPAADGGEPRDGLGGGAGDRHRSDEVVGKYQESTRKLPGDRHRSDEAGPEGRRRTSRRTRWPACRAA